MVLFHSTRRRIAEVIRREGLRAQKRKSFNGQVGENLVYFAMDEDTAGRFAELADNIPESLVTDKIVILVVHYWSLDNRYIYADPNIILCGGDVSTTIAYGKEVPPSEIGIINFDENKIEPLTEVEQLSNKYYYGYYYYSF